LKEALITLTIRKQTNAGVKIYTNQENRKPLQQDPYGGKQLYPRQSEAEAAL
jgi:hypothetical protein